jgi:hypothetical protein
MAIGEIIIQIMFITIGMVALSEVLNRILGINMGAARELREKSQNLQERMRTARLTRDVQEIQELQQESVELSKQMLKKQMLPSCLRCLIFWVLFGILQVVYIDYYRGLLPFELPFFGSGWFAIYFLFSITFSLIIYGFKRLYRKLTGKEVKRSRASRGMLGGQIEDPEQIFQLTREIPNDSMQEEVIEEIRDEEGEPSKNDSWKDRIK